MKKSPLIFSGTLPTQSRDYIKVFPYFLQSVCISEDFQKGYPFSFFEDLHSSGMQPLKLIIFRMQFFFFLLFES